MEIVQGFVTGEIVSGQTLSISPTIKNVGTKDCYALVKVEMLTYGSGSPAYTFSPDSNWIKVMITASHNPSRYNGYKVYGADDCQITIEAASEILDEIKKLDIFADVKIGEKAEIESIKPEVLTAFIEEVKGQSVLFEEEIDKNVATVYSSLNGTGYIPVTRTLSEMGYTNITLVEEQ